MDARLRTASLAVFCLLAIPACHSNRFAGTFYFSSQTGDAIIESHSPDAFHVAWYRRGEIVGADEAFASPDFPLAGLFDDTRPCVDHPSIGTWREQLVQMRDVSTSAAASSAEVLRAVRGFPFDTAVEDTLEAWVGDDPERAATVLDNLGDIEVGDGFAETLTEIASAAQADDARLAGWMRGLFAGDHDEAVVRVLDHPAAGAHASRFVLPRIDDVPSRDRARVFRAAARHVAADPTAAYMLLDAAEELSSHDETDALLDVLDEGASRELVRETIRTIDDRLSSRRLELFSRAARLAADDPTSHYTIARVIDDLPSRHRLAAVTRLVEDAATPRELRLLLVDVTDDLLSRDRVDFLMAVLDGAHGDDRELRRAVRDAATAELPRRDRERVLERLVD